MGEDFRMAPRTGLPAAEVAVNMLLPRHHAARGKIPVKGHSINRPSIRLLSLPEKNTLPDRLIGAAMPTAVIVPTYNESDNIPSLVRQILALPINIHVIVVDDNSPDGTGKLVDEIAKAEPRVHTVHRSAKMGLGTAHIAGMRQAFALNLDPIVSMDADFSHHPRYILDLLAGLDKFDVMIGSRYVGGGGMQGRNLLLRFVSWGANLFARTMLNFKTNDCTSGFRAYRGAVLESINLDSVFSNGYSFLIEMLFLCQSTGWRTGETPIIYEDRCAGTSKISRAEIFKAIYTVLRLTYRRLRNAKDLLFNRDAPPAK
jgi:dolichol-phosphate mannosyltransferase